jgi:small GTP-binding protein
MTSTAKVVVLGTAMIGKTCIVNYATNGTFNGDQTATIGSAFSSKKVSVGNTEVLLQIWDTAGQERFRSLAPMYYHGAQVALLVFDLTSEATLGEARRWATELRHHTERPPLLYLVGNKQDLADQRVITEAEGQKTAAELKAVYFETSALTGFNVELLFQDIAEHALTSNAVSTDEAPLAPVTESDSQKGRFTFFSGRC